MMDERLAFVEADGQVGVAEVNGEEHGASIHVDRWTCKQVNALCESAWTSIRTGDSIPVRISQLIELTHSIEAGAVRYLGPKNLSPLR
jgi:hypothetical protein